jgi:hypothetical protein
MKKTELTRRSSIDRIIALWQALNPDSYVEPMADTYGTFVIEYGTIETVDTRAQPPLLIEYDVSQG